MTDQNDGSTQPISSNPPTDPPTDSPGTPPPADAPTWLPADVPEGAQPPPPPAPALRERSFRARSVAAVAAVALLVGGGLGATIGVVASGDDHGDDIERVGFDGRPDGQHFDHAPDGQLPPGSVPDDDDDEDDD